MNAPHAFDQNATSTQQPEPEPYRGSYLSERVIKRRARRRIMQRFEQAFFVGLLLTLIAFTVHVVFSENSAPSAAGASSIESALTPESNVSVTWEDEPTFEDPTVTQLEGSESYSTVGEEADTTWLKGEGENGDFESSPYIKDKSASEIVLEPVPAPAAMETEMNMEVLFLERELGTDVSSAESTTVALEQEPGSEVPVVESRRSRWEQASAPIGLLRVGGGHARDLERLYASPVVVYGLE